MTKKILIVEDEKNLRENLGFIFTQEGYTVMQVSDGLEAKNLILLNTFDIILCDIRLPNIDGLELVKLKPQLNYEPKFIVMTAYGSIQSAVDAIKLGAEEYITKPLRNEEIIRKVNRISHISVLENQNKKLKHRIKKGFEIQKNIIGNSDVMRRVFDRVDKVASVDTSVLIVGENGTGKELIAKAIHSYSNRDTEIFLPVNCAAIPENLFESEFFGYEKGAFTGATAKKLGIFEEANGGIIFLDEVSEIPIHMQAKLLRVIQERTVRRVGGSKHSSINVRIICASNKDLKDMVSKGLFREDLYYRIKVVVIDLPPLRKREGDIELLTRFFIDKYSKQFNKNITHIYNDALTLLDSWSWEGNVRELEHIIQSAIVLTESDCLSKSDFENLLDTKEKLSIILPSNDYDLKNILDKLKAQVEKELISKALRKTNGNRTKAANLLGISHRNILYKLNEYDIAEGERYD